MVSFASLSDQQTSEHLPSPTGEAHLEEVLAELGPQPNPNMEPTGGVPRKRGLIGDEEDLVVGGRSCCLKGYNSSVEVGTHEAWSQIRSDRLHVHVTLPPGVHCMPSAGP